MGLMDFLKKKNDSGMGMGAETDGLNFNSNNLTADKTGLPQSNFGQEYHLDQNDLNPSMNMQGLSSMNSSPSAFGQPVSVSQSPAQNSNMERDMQIISLKLDAIKSELDAMNQRLKNLESIAEREQLKANTQKKWY